MSSAHRVRLSHTGHEDDSVMIVNDSPEQLQLMNALLLKAGYSVIAAEDGLEALELAREKRPDLVISDVSMPRMNGLEFCRLIRQDGELRFIPILLISAQRKDTKSVVAGLEAGADDYLEVPFDSTRLVAKVSRLLERSRLEANYRNLVEHASDTIFTQDLEGRLTNLNTAGSRFLGRSQQEVIGTPFNDAFRIQTQNGSFLGPLEDKELRTQFIATNAGGEQRWLDLVLSPIKDRLGDTIGFRGLARDITDRKEIEIALRDSEERYRTLFESTPQPIWVYDEVTFGFLAVNDAATRIYGFSREEFLSMTIDRIRLSEGAPALLIKSPDGAGDPILSSPWRHKTKDERIIYVEMNSHAVIFNQRPARLVIVNDVTERKLLDEQQRRMHTSLQHSAMEWRQTFNAIEFPVLILDLTGQIKRANEAAEVAAAPFTGEITGKNIMELGDGQPWKKAAELLREIQANESSPSAEISDELSGKTWTITLYVIHEFGSFGDRAILIAQDITKRTQLETSLRQSEKMSLLGSLVAGVAHEVRNPLFGISSILDAFETRFSDRKDYLRYTDVLRDEIGRLALLMEELLEYGKPFRGDLYLVSLEEVIAKSLRACLPAAEVAGVTLLNEFGNSLPKVMVDRRRLSKVFVNLIENAIQHSQSGGSVTVESRQVFDAGKEWVESAVRDMGTGILAQDMPRIFEPFFSKRRGGTGLGLAIAQRIMEEHGGKISAANNPEGGACMTIRFPLPIEEGVHQ
ncbi:MAG TPA: PAS domain S-box protein [Pyrinomonadaceae bacterium]